MLFVVRMEHAELKQDDSSPVPMPSDVGRAVVDDGLSDAAEVDGDDDFTNVENADGVSEPLMNDGAVDGESLSVGTMDGR